MLLIVGHFLQENLIVKLCSPLKEKHLDDEFVKLVSFFFPLLFIILSGFFIFLLHLQVLAFWFLACRCFMYLSFILYLIKIYLLLVFLLSTCQLAFVFPCSSSNKTKCARVSLNDRTFLPALYFSSTERALSSPPSVNSMMILLQLALLIFV